MPRIAAFGDTGHCHGLHRTLQFAYAPSMTDTASVNRPDTEKRFWLRGNYAPVMEEVTAHDLQVTGSIPPELNGRYLRNGANPQSGESVHWFAGDGMIHGIELRDGKAQWYRNRWVQTRQLNEPDARLIGDDGSIDRTIGVSNTHVIGHAGKILALVESSFPCELTPDLQTVGPYDYGGRLESAMTAHPKLCPVTGELHFFGYGFFEPYLTYNRVSADGELVQSEPIAVNGSTMMHDFSITENHIIFMDLPVVFNLDKAMAGGMPYQWDDDYPARVGVMPRSTADASYGSDHVTWFDVDPCYVFHPMNSFEDSAGKIVMDTARYPELWRKDSSFENDAALHRWSLDLGTGKATESALDDRAIEFPRVAESLVGLPNRFGYAVASFEDKESMLVKYDLDTGASSAHSFGDEQIPGEAVFVPREGASNEDDGWLLTYVYDKASNSSEFVVLDAADMYSEPQAVVKLPQRIPFGFHGSWIADE